MRAEPQRKGASGTYARPASLAQINTLHRGRGASGPAICKIFGENSEEKTAGDRKVWRQSQTRQKWDMGNEFRKRKTEKERNSRTQEEGKDGGRTGSMRHSEMRSPKENAPIAWSQVNLRHAKVGLEVKTAGEHKSIRNGGRREGMRTQSNGRGVGRWTCGEYAPFVNAGEIFVRREENRNAQGTVVSAAAGEDTGHTEMLGGTRRAGETGAEVGAEARNTAGLSIIRAMQAPGRRTTHPGQAHRRRARRAIRTESSGWRAKRYAEGRVQHLVIEPLWISKHIHGNPCRPLTSRQPFGQDLHRPFRVDQDFRVDLRWGGIREYARALRKHSKANVAPRASRDDRDEESIQSPLTRARPSYGKQWLVATSFLPLPSARSKDSGPAGFRVLRKSSTPSTSIVSRMLTSESELDAPGCWDRSIRVELSVLCGEQYLTPDSRSPPDWLCGSYTADVLTARRASWFLNMLYLEEFGFPRPLLHLTLTFKSTDGGTRYRYRGWASKTLARLSYLENRTAHWPLYVGVVLALLMYDTAFVEGAWDGGIGAGRLSDAGALRITKSRTGSSMLNVNCVPLSAVESGKWNARNTKNGQEWVWRLEAGDLTVLHRGDVSMGTRALGSTGNHCQVSPGFPDGVRAAMVSGGLIERALGQRRGGRGESGMEAVGSLRRRCSELYLHHGYLLQPSFIQVTQKVSVQLRVRP
ncbi:hypothetical protein C8R44DRAFT_733242 [Mycena epipterygia]|nr:hypothetical protein C8R44DRAFT_733242 [Mycena epipterygia]